MLYFTMQKLLQFW